MSGSKGPRRRDRRRTEALLELMRWAVALEDDAARQVGKTSPTAAKPKESRARIEAEAEG